MYIWNFAMYHHQIKAESQYFIYDIADHDRFPTGSENLEKSNFLEKSWEVMELWKIIKSRGKIMELRKSHTDKSSPALEIWHW